VLTLAAMGLPVVALVVNAVGLFLDASKKYAVAGLAISLATLLLLLGKFLLLFLD
jgi:hypothetical protein